MFILIACLVVRLETNLFVGDPKATRKEEDIRYAAVSQSLTRFIRTPFFPIFQNASGLGRQTSCGIWNCARQFLCKQPLVSLSEGLH